MTAIKPYQKKFDYSYTLGAFPTLELLEMHPEKLEFVLLSSEASKDLYETVKLRVPEHKIKTDDKLLHKLSKKENTYVLGVFRKYEMTLTDDNHLVLVDPSNFGNLGTMIRTAIAFDIKNIALIGEPCDHFNPAVIRSSMGALFRLNIENFHDIDEYKHKYHHNLYALMVDGDTELLEAEFKIPYSIILGNESSGLPSDYHSIATSIRIRTTNNVDSLNITSACSIALYIASRK